MDDYFKIATNVAQRKTKKIKLQQKESNEIKGANYYEKEKKYKKNKEQILIDEIAKFLINKNYLVIRVNSSFMQIENSKRFLRGYIIYNSGASSGFPDLLALKNNKYLLLEIKATGTLSENQQKFKQLCEEKYVKYNIIKNLDELKNILGE